MNARGQTVSYSCQVPEGPEGSGNVDTVEFRSRRRPINGDSVSSTDGQDAGLSRDCGAIENQIQKSPKMANSGALTDPLVPSSSSTTAGSDNPNVRVSPWAAFVNGITSGVSNLARLLPTGTFLAFTTVAPIITNNGTCDQPSFLWLTVATTLFFAAYCFFSCFTDSFQASDGKVYYGIVTIGGLWTPQLPAGLQPMDQEKYRLKFSDFIYALLSLAVFGACALMTPNVRSCLYPDLSESVVMSVPIVVSFFVSLVFSVFPSTRHGIGFPVSPATSSSGSKVE
ncbi:hypothetical protein Mapa_016824 [Marchantia paleacea]|nr:hypothetical protein Mapa_016824 [Marchantia paleacea]